MAERTPVIRKYRDALETVIGATMDFLARIPPTNPNPNHDPAFSLASPTMAKTPQQGHREIPVSDTGFSPGFIGAAPESYVRGSPKVGPTPSAADGSPFNSGFDDQDDNGLGYMPDIGNSPLQAADGRRGELGQMDAEWLLSLCEGDGFSLSMLNEMMRFEPSLGA
jgi:hypothetical protein